MQVKEIADAILELEEKQASALVKEALEKRT